MLDNVWVKKGILIFVVYLVYLWSWNSAFGNETTPPFILSLTKHISQEEVQHYIPLLSTIKEEQSLVIIINSNSGDLPSTLELAKKIFTIKSENHTKVIVYIEENAIGPAAILPFLADELMISPFMIWGDIPLENEKIFASNNLRNRVLSLISQKTSQAQILSLLAIAMCDSSVQLIEDHGWRLAKEGEESSHFTLNAKGQTLVVNHHQLEQLGLVYQTINTEKFHSLFSKKADSETEVFSSLALQGEALPKTVVEDELKKYILFNPEGPNTIGHILIDDHESGINQSTWLYVKSALDHYKEIKPAFIILELNTPGGEVFPAQMISDALKEMDIQHNIPVVALVNNWAISAGAMLAYSSRFIAVVKDSSMGAAEPVTQNAEGKMESVSEKINSAFRTDFANRARFFDRDPAIAEAMVDKDMIVVLRHGKVIKLDNENQFISQGANPDILISPKGKLLTLTADLLINYGVADLFIPPTKTEAINSEEKETGKWSAKKMAFFHQPFFDAIPNATIDSYRMDWKTKFFTLLASPLVSSLLLMGLTIGLYMEFTTPGFGIPGTVAVTCLFLIILSSYSLEIANWLEVILVLVGLAVIIIELFILPTFGLLGFIGILFFLAGLFGMLVPGLHSIDFEQGTTALNAAGEAVFIRFAWLSASLLLSILMMIIIGRCITPKMAKWSRLVLQGNEQEGYYAVDNPKDLPAPGALGEVYATLRPSGKVIIDDKLYEAVSRGGLIEKGTKITVYKVEGSSLIVTTNTLESEEGN